MSNPSEHTVGPSISELVADTSPTISNPDETEVSQLVDRLIGSKRITYVQYQTLSKMVLADGTVDEQERRQINRLFDAIQSGAVRIVE